MQAYRSGSVCPIPCNLITGTNWYDVQYRYSTGTGGYQLSTSIIICIAVVRSSFVAYLTGMFLRQGVLYINNKMIA